LYFIFVNYEYSFPLSALVNIRSFVSNLLNICLINCNYLLCKFLLFVLECIVCFISFKSYLKISYGIFANIKIPLIKDFKCFLKLWLKPNSKIWVHLTWIPLLKEFELVCRIYCAVCVFCLFFTFFSFYLVFVTVLKHV